MHIFQWWRDNMTIVEQVANDKELCAKNEKIKEITGEYVHCHWSYYSSFEEFKEAVEKKYKEVMAEKLQ